MLFTQQPFIAKPVIAEGRSVLVYSASQIHTTQATSLLPAWLRLYTLQCCSLSCNMTKKDLFLSSSWDDSIKLWSLGHQASLRTFPGHTYCVYHVAW